MFDQATSSDAATVETAADSVVALARMLADVDRLWQQIERDRERLESALPDDDPGRHRATWIEIGQAPCASEDEVRSQAKRMRIDPMPLVERWMAKERARTAARRRAGLDRLDLADRMARSGWREIRNQIATTEAASLAGVAAKLELLTAGMRDGPVGDELGLAESALRDLARLGAQPGVQRGARQGT